MELLQRLTRRQLEVLRIVESYPTRGKGVPLEDIASTLGIKPPSALEHLKALQYLGLVRRASGKSRLTDKGKACLNEYYRHHRIMEGIFFQMNLPADEACEAAKEVDLAISHEIIEKLCAAQGHPKLCPHGQPIAPCSEEKSDGGDGS